jgi:hypothetical protein
MPNKEQHNKELRRMKQVVSVIGTFFVFSLILSIKTMIILAVIAANVGIVAMLVIMVYRGLMRLMSPNAVKKTQ